MLGISSSTYIQVITKTHTYWKEDSSSGGNAASIKGDTDESGPIGPHGPKGVRGDIGPSGGAAVQGDRGGAGPPGPKEERGVTGVQGENMDISNFPTSYYNQCQKDRSNVFCVVYDTTSSKSSLWVNHGKIYDFMCRLPLKPSMLNLFNRVVHFDDASGFNGYIESVEMFNYYKTIPSGLTAARMTYLLKRADGST